MLKKTAFLTSRQGWLSDFNRFKMARSVWLFPALAVMLLYPAQSSTQAGKTGLLLNSQQGDFIGRGKAYSYDCAAFLAPRASDRNRDGLVDTVEFDYGTGVWSVDFSTAKLNNTALEKGIYLDAQRLPFADAGHPGLNISGMGRGCNMLTGLFNVLDAQYDLDSNGNPRVISFAATFEQHCEGGKPAFFGTVYFNSTAVSDTTKPVVSQVNISSRKITRRKDPKLTISWKATDNTGVTGYQILFIDLDRFFEINQDSTFLITQLPATATSFTWTIPSSVSNTKSGAIQVVALDAFHNSGEAVGDLTFEIEN